MNSRARLVVARGRVLRLAATAPQRWSRPLVSSGRVQVVHQLVGDGLFDGECHRTSIAARDGSHLTVLGIAATPLRSLVPASVAVRLSVDATSSLCYLPGALIPHAGTGSSHALLATVEPGGSFLAGSILLAGRTGMGESGAFDHLRFRTVIRSAGRLVLAEDATLRPAETPLAGPASFAGADASLSLVAVGGCADAAASAWPSLVDLPGVVAGVSLLRGGGVALRGLAATLGDARAMVLQASRLAGFACDA